MTRFGYIALGFASVFAVLEGAFRYREGLLQFPVMLLYPVWLLLIPLSAWRLPWRGHGSVAISSALIIMCLIAAPFIGGRIGVSVRDHVFRSRLPEYEAIVQQLRAGTAPVVPSRLAYRVTHRALPDGDVQVLFWWGGGFPVKHTVLAYHPTDPRTDPDFRSAWRRAWPIAKNWYVAKD